MSSYNYILMSTKNFFLLIHLIIFSMQKSINLFKTKIIYLIKKFRVFLIYQTILYVCKKNHKMGNKTFTIIKPDAFGAGNSGPIIEKIEKAIEVQIKGFSIALLTNLFTEFYPTVKKELADVNFDAWVASSEEGARKPETEIYKRTEELLQVKGERILFLDDFEPNLFAAQEFGWSTIEVTDPLDAMKKLEK